MFAPGLLAGCSKWASRPAEAPPDGVAGAVYSMGLPSLVPGSRAGASLEIDATGRRHAAFWTYLSGEVIYATCATNCTQAANWTTLAIASSRTVGYAPDTRYFDLDPQGRPRALAGTDNEQMTYDVPARPNPARVCASHDPLTTSPLTGPVNTEWITPARQRSQNARQACANRAMPSSIRSGVIVL